MLLDLLLVGDMTAPARAGLIAGRYQLVAPIGSGGTATMYCGLFRGARRGQDPPSRSAEVYDVVSGEDSPYIVMQLIEGRPLAELIAERGPLPPHRVAGIGRQVLAALVAGHVVGVLHQDLEPGNVMITPGGQAVLTAFGLAGMTAPGYLAPERASGLPATPAADLWSLGATLHAALCGHLEAFCMNSKSGLSVFRTVQLSQARDALVAVAIPAGQLRRRRHGIADPTDTEILTRTASGALAYATWTAQHGWSSWSMLPSPA